MDEAGHRRRGVAASGGEFSCDAEFPDMVLVAEPVDNDDFVHVNATLDMKLHRAAHGCRIGRYILWAWFILLVVGELLTTLWWLHSMGVYGLLSLTSGTAMISAVMYMALGREQSGVVLIALVLALAPGLPAYAAVMFILPLGGLSGTSSSSWAMLHWPTFFAIAFMYLGDAIRPLAYIYQPSVRDVVNVAVGTLNSAQTSATNACVIAILVYAAVSAHVIYGYVNSGDVGASTLWMVRRGLFEGPLADPHGIVLVFHAIGLVCAAARRRTLAALGDDVLPLLLGSSTTQSWKAVSQPTCLQVSVMLAAMVWSVVPQLRRFTPPPGVIAFILATRNLAPVLLPTVALIFQAAGWFGYQWSAFVLVVLLVFLGRATIAEWKILPRRTLQRLPLLLPHGMLPLRHTALGYALVAVERAERLRMRATNIFRRRTPQRSG